jgi:DNA-binding transcriptional ArsR family regulator
MGISRSTAHEYLSALRDAGVAELTAPRGRGSRFILARKHKPRQHEPEPPPAARPDGYVTLHDLAEAVRDGRAGEVDDGARTVLARVLEAGPRPRLTVVPEPESDAS